MDFFSTFLNPSILAESLPLLLSGALTTIGLGVLCIALALPLGTLVCLGRMYGSRPVGLAARIYIDVVRAVPALVLLILIHYALPFAGISFEPLVSVTLALTIIMSAYTAELVRAGIEAIPKGQFEACHALGLSTFNTMRLVVLPQALRTMVPPFTSNCVSLFKDTALASVVTMPDLLKQATDAQAIYANPTPLMGAAAIYIGFLWPMVILVNRMERRRTV